MATPTFQTAPLAVEGARPRAISLRWIIGARDDLVWFIGSVAVSYLLFGLHSAGVLPLLPLVLGWSLLLDAPHVFGTFSRTYFDREERRARRRLLLGSLAFFAVGPLMVLAGWGPLFFIVIAPWTYYHLVKQHYGFMVLYKKKNADLAPADNALDRAFLLTAMAYPFVAFAARKPVVLKHLPAELAGALGVLEKALFAATVAITILWVGRQVHRAIQGRPLDVPKYLLLAAAVPMHWVVLLSPVPLQTLAIGVFLTIYHNLQYHRLVWFHNRKYAGRREQHGAAEVISRRLPYYVAFGVIFGLWSILPGELALRLFGPQSLAAQLIAAFFWGYALIHYHLDAHIWRVRRDPAVGAALRMS
jgi:hypothetical protein